MARELRNAPPPDAASALAQARQRVVGIEGWELGQWHEAIDRMYSLSVKHDLKLHKACPGIIITPTGSVGQFGRATVTMLEPRPPLSVGQVPPFVVYPGSPERHILDGVIVPRSALPAMLVDLTGSDEHILAEVERALRERKGNEWLHRTRGRYTLSQSLTTRKTWDRWKNNHVVELVEMRAWSKDGGHGYSWPDIGLWVHSSLDEDKRVQAAVKVARQAIAALPAILAEVSKTTPPD